MARPALNCVSVAALGCVGGFRARTAPVAVPRWSIVVLDALWWVPRPQFYRHRLRGRRAELSRRVRTPPPSRRAGLQFGAPAGTMASTAASVSIDMLDGWVDQLYECKPLSEADVKSLCDKVRGRRCCRRCCACSWDNGAARPVVEPHPCTRSRGASPVALAMHTAHAAVALAWCVRPGTGGASGGVERAARACACHSVWRRPRPVPRPHGAVPHRRALARHELPVHGRLR